MTIVESIKCVLQQNNDGLTSKQIYDEIIRQGLYSFGAENPVGVVNAQLRRRCIGLDFPTAYPIKFFEIAGYEGKKDQIPFDFDRKYSHYYYCSQNYRYF